MKVENEDLVFAEIQRHSKGLSTDALASNFPQIDPTAIIQVVNSLLTQHKLDLLTYADGSTGVKARPKAVVEKISLLQDSERQVYLLIYASESTGTWLKDVKAKSGLHQKDVTNAIKSLETKFKFIKSVKSVKAPTKKLYMAVEFEPGSELTGGAWYTDEKLDEEFIDTLASQLLKYIAKKSTIPGANGNEGTETKTNSSMLLDSSLTIANYKQYPNLKEMYLWIKNSGIAQVGLSRQDVNSLLQRLEYEGSIERIQAHDLADSDDGEWGMSEREAGDCFVYRAVGTVGVNAATDIPCGVCPVFKFCSSGGPVSPESCVYFPMW